MWAYSSDSEPCLLYLQDEPTPQPLDVDGPVDNCGGQRVFSPEEHQAIGGAIEKLSIQLLENLPVGPQQPNVILSPLSLAFALAQLTLGQGTLQSVVHKLLHH